MLRHAGLIRPNAPACAPRSSLSLPIGPAIRSDVISDSPNVDASDRARRRLAGLVKVPAWSHLPFRNGAPVEAMARLTDVRNVDGNFLDFKSCDTQCRLPRTQQAAAGMPFHERIGAPMAIGPP